MMEIFFFYCRLPIAGVHHSCPHTCSYVLSHGRFDVTRNKRLGVVSHGAEFKITKQSDTPPDAMKQHSSPSTTTISIEKKKIFQIKCWKNDYHQKNEKEKRYSGLTRLFCVQFVLDLLLTDGFNQASRSVTSLCSSYDDTISFPPENSSLFCHHVKHTHTRDSFSSDTTSGSQETKKLINYLSPIQGQQHSGHFLAKET